MLKEAVAGIEDAICGALDGEYELHRDNIEQDMNLPCFLITPILATNKHVVMKRYERTYSFMIQYIPKYQSYIDESAGLMQRRSEELADVAEMLMDALEIIEIDGQPHGGSNMESVVVDDVLNFSVDYTFFLLKEPEKDEPMETLSISIYLKG